MRAVRLHGQGVELISVDDPTPGSGQLLLEVTCAGICGSDITGATSGVPQGTILGHEISGRVVARGADVDARWTDGTLVAAVPAIGCGRCHECLSGAVVHCRRAEHLGISRAGAFADYVVVAASESLDVSGLSERSAAVIEPLAVGLNTVERAGSLTHERVLVVGAGPIGLAAVIWARELGAISVVASDPVAVRRELAGRCGADHVIDPLAEDVEGAHRRLTGERPSVILECAGGQLVNAMAMLRRRGTIVVAAYHSAPAPVNIQMGLQREATVSFVSYYNRRHFVRVARSLELGRIPVDDYVTHEISLEELPETFEALKHPNDQGKVLIRPGSG